MLAFTFLGMNLFVTAYSESDFFGKLIFLGLIALSAYCWVILLHKVWLIRKVSAISKIFQEKTLEKDAPLFSLDLSDLPKISSRQIPHPFAHIFFNLKEKALEVLNKNHFFVSQHGSKDKAVYLSRADLDLIESHVLTTISMQSKQLEKNLFILSTITTLAPFLGLLGTVWGIVITFSELHTGATVSSSSVVLGGLSTALAATVLGLVIAIPSLVSYNYLKNASKNLTSDMEDFLYQLLSRVEMQYRKVDIE